MVINMMPNRTCTDRDKSKWLKGFTGGSFNVKAYIGFIKRLVFENMFSSVYIHYYLSRYFGRSGCFRWGPNKEMSRMVWEMIELRCRVRPMCSLVFWLQCARRAPISAPRSPWWFVPSRNCLAIHQYGNPFRCNQLPWQFFCTAIIIRDTVSYLNFSFAS